MTVEILKNTAETDHLGAIAASLAAGVSQRLELPNGHVGYLVPDGFALTSHAPIEPVLPPTPNAHTVTIEAADTAIDYLKRFKTDNTVIFASGEDLTCAVAVLDYHGTGNKTGKCGHKMIFKPQLATQWKAWAAHDGKALSQEAFIDHLEDNAVEIIKPEAAEMMELVANFRQVRNETFSKSFRARDGRVQLTFRQEDGEGNVEMPPEFRLEMPVHRGGPSYEFRAILRTRTSDGKLVFFYSLHRRAMLLEAILGAMVASIAEAADVPLYFGGLRG